METLGYHNVAFCSEMKTQQCDILCAAWLHGRVPFSIRVYVHILKIFSPPPGLPRYRPHGLKRSACLSSSIFYFVGLGKLSHLRGIQSWLVVDSNRSRTEENKPKALDS